MWKGFRKAFFVAPQRPRPFARDIMTERREATGGEARQPRASVAFATLAVNSRYSTHRVNARCERVLPMSTPLSRKA